MNVELLKSAGVDYAAGLAHLMDDAELYEAVLAAFVSDDVLQRAQAAFRAGDRDALLRAAHEAKGSTGSADLTAVYAEACELVKLLRGGCGTEEEIAACFHRFESVYTSVQNGVRAAMEV